MCLQEERWSKGPANKRKNIGLGPGHRFFGEVNEKVFIMETAFFFSLVGVIDRAHVTNYMTGAWPENPILVN